MRAAGFIIAAAAFAAWLWLLFARGYFWRCGERDDGPAAIPPQWPNVIALVPARDEAETIGAVIAGLMAQDYPGEFSIVLIDDQSGDATAELAAEAARNGRRSLRILSGEVPPPGWTGKLWALQQGLNFLARERLEPEFVWLTDADIAYAPDALSRLAGLAQSRGLVLASWMAKLRCLSLAEKCLIPAFIFFFQMLYPFAWVSRADSPTAAAAGGCVLARLRALAQIGGFQSIRGALIDDCALAAAMKKLGPISLQLTERAMSLRPYPGFDDIRRMVARSAYAQLDHSPARLAGTVAGMGLIFVAPPLMALTGGCWSAPLGLWTWILMALAFQPVLRFYGLSRLWGLALPWISALYLAYTFDSARQHWRGRGGYWKGRVQAPAGGRT